MKKYIINVEWADGTTDVVKDVSTEGLYRTLTLLLNGMSVDKDMTSKFRPVSLSFKELE